VDDGDVDALGVTEEETRRRGFTPAPFGEGNVVPTSEQVAFVPERLAMAEQDQIRHRRRLANARPTRNLSVLSQRNFLEQSSEQVPLKIDARSSVE